MLHVDERLGGRQLLEPLHLLREAAHRRIQASCQEVVSLGIDAHCAAALEGFQGAGEC